MSTTYTSISQQQAATDFRNLEAEADNRNICKKIDIIVIEMRKKNPNLKLIDIITSELFDNKQNFYKMRKYFEKLSKINFRSGMKDTNIFKKIKKLRNFFQISQTGDYTYIRHNVQLVLASQVNTKTSILIHPNSPQTKAAGKTKKKKTKNKEKN